MRISDWSSDVCSSDLRSSGGQRAVLYARVSTAEQEKEGFSIDAQVASIREYAERMGFVVAQQYVDVETAKKTGRTQFEAMLKYLRGHPGVRHLLVEKTDRLYRNIKDWVTLDGFDIELKIGRASGWGRECPEV